MPYQKERTCLVVEGSDAIVETEVHVRNHAVIFSH
jgi:hypothetical protein